jgi:HAD superfamily hydrolase (TIGR01509 family)
MNKEIKHYLEKHGFEVLRPKAVLFDMDGVLYDSMPNHAVAWQQSMAKFDILMTQQDAYATEGARGVDTIRMMVKKQQGRDINEVEAQLMYDEKTRIFHQMPEAPIMPGVTELMQKMKADGLTIGVVTGSGQRPLIQRLLTDFSDFLDENHITTAYDVKKGKPAPDPYLAGLQKMGELNPWEALVVENAPLGVRAGAAARIFTIAVNTGPLPDSSLTEAGADLLFTKMTDLKDRWQEISGAFM